MKRLVVGLAALAFASGSAAAQESHSTGLTLAPLPPPLPAPRDVAYPGTIKLSVDATDLQHRLFRVKQTIPVVAPGPMTLLYPQWLPGNHAPRGPISNLAGLQVRAGGQLLPWRRDPVEVYAFIVDVPAGATAVEVEFQQLTPLEGEQGRIQITPEMLNLQWEKALLYPAGYYNSRIVFEPSVTLPAGWKFGVALDGASTTGATTTFAPVSLETLVDSPMFAGQHFRQVDLDPGARIPVRLDIVADAAENLVIADAQLQQHRALVVQADRLFGRRQFDRYDFLLATTDRLGGIGLEHHRSSENGVESDYFTNWSKSLGDHELLPHEYVHSWNGKHRRGADLWTPNYNVPMRNSLLWVYEGQTQYWGHVLGARSGLLTKAQTLEQLALYAAQYDLRPGRAWRPLADTTNGPIVGARRPTPWTSWFRAEDYYVEGLLVWLDADTLIRERSGGKRSLDDFARAFFGDGPGGKATVDTYTLEELVAALNAVEPYDWGGFLNTRLQSAAANGPLDGLARGGYRLIYAEAPSATQKLYDGPNTNLVYSLGLSTDKDGKVAGVLWDSPAFNAGLRQGVTIVSVGDRTFTGDALREAVTAAKGGAAPVTLMVKEADRLRTVTIPYTGGLRYPVLERVAGTPARLDAIYAARR